MLWPEKKMRSNGYFIVFKFKELMYNCSQSHEFISMFDTENAELTENGQRNEIDNRAPWGLRLKQNIFQSILSSFCNCLGIFSARNRNCFAEANLQFQ